MIGARFALLAALGLAAMLGADPAAAAITSARATPGVQTVPGDRSVGISITYSIRITGGAGSFTVDADDGAFYIGVPPGVVAAVVPPGLTRTINSAVARPFYNFTFTERLNVPLDIIRQAIAARQPLYYRREFTDDGFISSTPVDVRINIGGGIAGRLTVSRMRLMLEGGQTVCSAAAGDDITAEAYIETEGSGLLRGTWEMRETLPDGNFRTLKTVQIPVTAGRNVTVKSPRLPLSGAGRVDFRFTVTEPPPAFAAPIVTCLVAGRHPLLQPDVPAGVPVKVLAPKSFMPLDRNTQVVWQPKEGAKAYRIEVLAEERGQPIAAQEMKAEDTSGKLSPLALEKLDPKRRYKIRVLAQ
ncbi:MAG: hypothetical protein Q8K65_12060 [Alphaproteobacteria bacterium]|nr:hypothetical protein [Alphaproteobacteria bacterium]